MSTALARFDFRSAASAVFEIVEQANRYVEAAAPWHLARAERAGDDAAGAQLDQVLGALITACQVLASEIWPFLPDLAARSGSRVRRLRREVAESAAAVPPDRDRPAIRTRRYPAVAAASGHVDSDAATPGRLDGECESVSEVERCLIEASLDRQR